MKTSIQYKLIILLIAIPILFAACDDYLSKNPDDISNIDTSGNLGKLLTSAYPQGSAYLMSEMMSDNTDQNGGTGWTAYDLVQTESYLWKNITQVTEDSPYHVWSHHYATIATACEVLNAIEKEGNPTSLNGVRAEALLCRAYGHFVLVNLFSQAYNATTSNTDMGIPYMIEPETNLFVKYDRETVAKTFERIEKDIEEALPMIGSAVYSVPKYHFNKEAAYAFASRFFLYYRKYDKAIKYATEALGTTPASKLRDWNGDKQYRNDAERAGYRYISLEQKANFLLVPATSIWARVHGPYRIGSLYTYNYYIAWQETTRAATPWGSLLQYSDYDYSASIKKMIVHKVYEFFEYLDPVAGIGWAHIVQALFTADETLLTRAEAYILNGELEKGFQDMRMFARNFYVINAFIDEPKMADAIQHYANMNYYTPQVATPKKAFNVDFPLTSDQENLLHGVLHLRRNLTLHEGLRWQDIKRYGIEISRRISNEAVMLETDRLTKNDLRRAIQLPQSIIESGVIANPR